MKKEEFIEIRKKLHKTQKEIAHLLGVSKKTIESYEQGIRNIPANTARILYFLLFKLNMDKLDKDEMCWQVNDCPADTRENCVAWVAREGFFCWFLTGKTCIRIKALSPNSAHNCYQCQFFKEKLEKILLIT